MPITEYLRLKSVEIPSGQSWMAGERSGLLFFFPRSGNCELLVGNRKQRILPGEVMVMAPASNEIIQAQGDESAAGLVFAVRFEHMLPLLEGEDFEVMQKEFGAVSPYKWLVATHPTAIETHSLINHVATLAPLKQRVYLLRVVAAILGKHAGVQRQDRLPQNPIERKLTRVLEQLSLDELVNLSVDELAARCNCSSRHLNYLFNQYFRSSVATLKMEVRLLKAISLLHSSRNKIIDVAMDCGFNNLGLFQTCFRRRFGVSPCKWRKMMVPSTEPESLSTRNETGCRKFGTEICPLTIAKAGGCGAIVNILAEQHAAVQKTFIRTI